MAAEEETTAPLRGMTSDTAFLQWARPAVDALAGELCNRINGASLGTRSSLTGYEAVYVHFRDAEIPQELALWVFAARERSAYNSPGRRDALAVGLKHDADRELDRGEFRARPLSPFLWTRHVDGRCSGYRVFEDLTARNVEAQAVQEFAERVMGALVRAGIVPR